LELGKAMEMLKEAEESAAKSKAEGEARGIALGEARGEARGVAIGKARERAERVAEALDLRFDKVPYQLTEQILMMTDLDRLEKLFRLACKCTSLAEFEAEFV
ncbi:MAG: hypothetical protein ACRC10_00675, partial [Thermoguttaceae bacterium]